MLFRQGTHTDAEDACAELQLPPAYSEVLTKLPNGPALIHCQGRLAVVDITMSPTLEKTDVHKPSDREMRYEAVRQPRRCLGGPFAVSAPEKLCLLSLELVFGENALVTQPSQGRKLGADVDS